MLKGWKTYFQKENIIIELHLKKNQFNKGNFNSRCKFYNKENAYEKCVEKNARKEIMKHLSCLPPWMTNDINTWCNGTMEVNKDKEEKIHYSLENILEGSTNCKKNMQGYKF